MNISYLKYTFHKYKLIYILLFILFIAVFPVLNLFITTQTKSMLLDIIYIPTILFFILAYVIPIWDFKQYYFKSVANLYFALPDKRENIYRTTTYFHIAACLLIYSVAISLGILVLFLKQVNINYLYLFVYLGFADLIFISCYLFQSFIASCCYNLKDAITLSLAYMGLPAVIMLVVYFGLRQEEVLLDFSKISFIGSIDHVTKYFVQFSFNQFGQGFDNYLSISLAFIISLILHFMTIYRVKRLKPELVGENTDSIFAYKLLQPLYLFMIMLLANYRIGYLAIVIHLVLIIAYLAYIYIKNRTLKINYYIIIEYAVFLVITNVLSYLVSQGV